MRHFFPARPLALLTAFSFLSLTGCGGASGGASKTGGSSGATSSGGAGASGGGAGTGGATSSGGGTSAGGATASGGAFGSGGTTASGGASASGGTTATGGKGGGTGVAGTSGSAGTGRAGTTGSAGTSGGASGKAGNGGNGGGGSGGSGQGGATPAKPSAGCSAASAPAAGRTTIDVSGTAREYILTLPVGYDPRRPYPLIVAFHGGQYNDDWLVAGDPPQSGPYYGLESAAKDAAILVASQALTGSWTNQNNRDIDYVVAMLTRFESQLCIDENRIFATGFSMGGIMTNTVACTEATVFRAVAAMSGRLPTTPATCTPRHPIAYWASHGMSDPTIAITEGQTARDTFASNNHCVGLTGTKDANGCTPYQGCDAGYPVVWCPFDGVHQPPPFAGAAIWTFFSQF